MKVGNYWGCKSFWLGTVLLSPIVVVLSGGIATAQVTDEIWTGGSRVRTTDSQITPIVVISADDLILKGDDVSNAGRAVIYDSELTDFNTINLEEHLNILPMVIPGTTAFSNDPGDGTANVDLRGLGSERTLVLVNGQRFVGTGGEGRIDLNAIPAALVKKIVVDTNFGSAVYGSGAIAGVVNFKLDDEFIGHEIGASYELSEQGDGGKQSVYLKLGHSFDDGRGQAMIFASYNKRDEVFAGDGIFPAKQIMIRVLASRLLDQVVFRVRDFLRADLLTSPI